jgi:hypothetical protein
MQASSEHKSSLRRQEVTTMVKRKEEILKKGEERVKVYLRLRPMDKLETSKRSKDCIELHDNPKIITVDSPLLGSFDFTFDQVRTFLTSHVNFLYTLVYQVVVETQMASWFAFAFI